MSCRRSSIPLLPSLLLRSRLLPAPGSLTKLRCAAVDGGTKTLCDITNLSRTVPTEDPEESTSAEGEVALLAKVRSSIYPNVLLTILACVTNADLLFSPKFPWLFQENADLLRLLEERK
jgi:hypothetical protein